jgi:hypothetical protein
MNRIPGGFTARTVLACLLAVLGAGCSQPSEAAPTGSQPPAATTGAPMAAGSAAAQDAVTRVVFIGKKEACDCTRKAIDASQKSLEAVLAGGHALPVEKLEADTDVDKVAGYKTMKPFMTLPAIYFLDINDGIVELLQGEVSEAQVKTALRLVP